MGAARFARGALARRTAAYSAAVLLCFILALYLSFSGFQSGRGYVDLSNCDAAMVLRDPSNRAQKGSAGEGASSTDNRGRYGCYVRAGRPAECMLSPKHEKVPAVFVVFHNTTFGKGSITKSQGLQRGSACPAWLAFNLRAAREATPQVVFVEEGTDCKRVCDTFGIRHIEFSYKDYADELHLISEKWLSRNDWAGAEWVLSFLRYRVLARVAARESSLQRFFYLDIDMFIRTDIRNASQYFEDYDIGLTTALPLGNAIYNLFTRDSIRDFADYVRAGLGFVNPQTKEFQQFGNDMVAVKSYATYYIPDSQHECTNVWPGPSALRKYGTCPGYFPALRPPHPPKYERVANLFDQFLGGELVEEFWSNHPGYFQMHKTDPASRVLEWRGGDLVQLRTTRRNSPLLHGIHLQGGAKHCTMFLYRPFSSNKSEKCQQALRKDCKCEHMCCHGCTRKVFEACNVTTRYFDVKDHMRAPFDGPWNFDLREDK